MKIKLVVITVCSMLIFGGVASAHERKVGILIDAACGKRLAESPAEAMSHQVSCSLKEECSKNGFGVIVDGRFFKFDKMGNKLATIILKNTDKKEGVRVRVDGHFDSYIISPSILEAID